MGKYFVKWVGWSADTNTWEPEANLECTDLLVNFYKTRVSLAGLGALPHFNPLAHLTHLPHLTHPNPLTPS